MTNHRKQSLIKEQFLIQLTEHNNNIMYGHFSQGRNLFQNTLTVGFMHLFF